jgi:tetratricopeptide (TPR) repeat protein
LAILNNIGIFYQKMGNYKKALEHLNEALVLKKKAVPSNHADIANTLNNIANVYRQLGDFDKALNYCDEALKLPLPTGHYEGTIENKASILKESFLKAGISLENIITISEYLKDDL